MAIAAGLINGQEIIIDDRPKLIKGSTVKTVTVTEVKTETVSKITETERLSQTIAVLDLTSGKLERRNSLSDSAGFGQFLIDYRDDLTHSVAEQYPPVFEPIPGWDRPFGRIHAPGKLPGQNHENGLLAAQKERAAALIELLRSGHKCGVLVGEMGCGKTAQSMAIMALVNGTKPFKIVVICPPQVIDKWAREASKVLREFDISTYVVGKKRKGESHPTPVLDLQQAMDDPKSSLIAISNQTAKNAAPWAHAVGRRIVRIERTYTKRVQEGYYWRDREFVEVQRKRVLACPDCGEPILEDGRYLEDVNQMKPKKQYTCQKCQSPLWQRVPFTYGGRIAIADLLNRKYAGRYSLIVDECFPPGTMVATPSGVIPIENISPGDTVLSIKNGNIVSRRVTRTIKKKSSDRRLIKVNHEQGTFECTPNHKIYIDGRYIQAGDLNTGDNLTIISHNTKEVITDDGYVCCVRERLRDTTEQQTSDLFQRLQIYTLFSEAINVRQDTKGLPCVQQGICTELPKGESKQDVQSRVRKQVKDREEDEGAKEKLPSKGMRVLPKIFFMQKLQAQSKILFQVLFCKGSDKGEGETWEEEDVGLPQEECGKIIFRTNEEKQSHVESVDCREDGEKQSGTWSLRDIYRPGRKWEFNRSTKTLVLRFRRWLGVRTYNPYRQPKVAWGYGRYSEYRVKDSYRGGWSVPQVEEAKESRQKERRDVNSVRVGSSEVLEFRSREGSRIGTVVHSGVLSVETVLNDGEYVYDLEVEDTHCYFADKVLVSNCHHGKGHDTDAGYAMQDAISGARKVIAMTGTIYGGKASSIFYLLYRLSWQFRQLYGYREQKRFVEHHGFFEQITTSEKGRSSWGYGREKVTIKEIPGVTPKMVTLLLSLTAFIGMDDMGLDMPPYTEYHHPVKVDSRLKPGIADITRIHSDVKASLAKGGMAGLSSWLHASLGWLDCPVQDKIEYRESADGDLIAKPISAAIPSKDHLSIKSLAKDAEIVKIVLSELGQGGGVGIYFSQVNRRDWMDRMQKLLAQHGVYSEILRQSDAKPADRETWYHKFVARCRKQGQEPVLLCNGSLVKEGMDLIELPTLIETGIEYRLTDLRQRIRRSWRLTQALPVKVIFVYYEGTWQEAAMRYNGSKLKSANMVDGRMDPGLAAINEHDGNLLGTLMQVVSGDDIRQVGEVGIERYQIDQTIDIDGTKVDDQPVMMVAIKAEQLALF
jgi:hypothetical protein